jgi:4-alpha-glucanotransferase
VTPPAAPGDDLAALAELAGIEPSYADYFGRGVTVSADTKRGLLRALGFGVDSPADVAASLAGLRERPWRGLLAPLTIAHPSQPALVTIATPLAAPRRIAWKVVEENGAEHGGTADLDALPIVERRADGGAPRVRRALRLDAPLAAGYHAIYAGDERAALVCAPARCYVPPQARDGAWGLTLQLYSLRSRTDWGIGDFTSLERFARTAAGAGADLIGLNPLHERNPASPDACSPYSPSSRFFLDVAYLDPGAIPEFAECERARALVAEPAFAAGLDALRSAPLVDYAGVWRRKDAVLRELFAWFRSAHVARDSERARTFASFVRRGGEALADLAAFEAAGDAGATERAGGIAYFQYLQWNADEQLAAAARACDGMRVGLYRDLAVGSDPAGADAWSDRRLHAAGVSIGAPPDELNVRGQTWGLAPLDPLVLRERGLEPFARLLRANMAHAGALRIDHAMGLARLFWVPAGMPATEGAYVRYPFDEALAVLALESVRNRCLVVGEDLGTVPAGFRERMASARILGTRILFFERDGAGRFVEPAAYPALSLAAAGTHDLPTLRAYLAGDDLGLRDRLGLLAEGETLAEALARRHADLAHLYDALGLSGDRSADDVVAAVYRFLGSSQSLLAVATLEDALGIAEQVNVPGTTWEHPNWRRRVPTDIAAIGSDERFAAVCRALRDSRAHGARSLPAAR